MLNAIKNQIATLIELRRLHRYYCECGYKTNSPSKFTNHHGRHMTIGLVDGVSNRVIW